MDEKGASLVVQTVKNLPAVQETRLRSLGWDDPPEKRIVNPLQYSCLENPMDREKPLESQSCTLFDAWAHKGCFAVCFCNPRLTLASVAGRGACSVWLLNQWQQLLTPWHPRGADSLHRGCDGTRKSKPGPLSLTLVPLHLTEFFVLRAWCDHSGWVRGPSCLRKLLRSPHSGENRAQECAGGRPTASFEARRKSWLGISQSPFQTWLGLNHWISRDIWPETDALRDTALQPKRSSSHPHRVASRGSCYAVV